MMDNKENVEMIDKFIKNFVYDEVPYDFDYSVGYDENYNKYVIRLTATIDVSKIFPSNPNFDENYSKQAYKIDSNLDDLIKYLGIPYNMIEFYLDFDYINYEFLDDEAELLKKMIESELLNTLNLDKQSVNDIGIYVDVRKNPEDYAYFEIEVGCSSDNVSYNTVEFIKNYSYTAIQESGKVPNLLSLLHTNGEIVFWFYE